MKSLLCATLAVALVAAVTAQSSQQTDDTSSIQGLIEKLNEVVSSLGGFEGTIDKLEHITKLVEKAYTDKGIGGWMARNLIKIELNQLKQKALEHEKEMINHLLDELESKTGLSSYSEEPAESYILSEAVKRAIALIRENIQQILSEIGKAQKEHDDAAGKISKDALGKITDRLNGLKDKLRGLSKRLLDKLTGRDKTADVYGADGGIRYEIEVPNDSYILSEMIKAAAQQLRERIFKYVEQIGEAKREAQKAFGEHKKQVLEHLEKLKQRLRKSMSDLKDTLLGRKTDKELEEEIKEDDTADDTYAAPLLISENYIVDGVVKELIGKLRVKIIEVIQRLGEAKREAERAAGDAKAAAKEHLAKLREQLKKLTRDLKDAILGRKTKEDLEKDLEEDEKTVQLLSSDSYILNKELIAKLQERVKQITEQLKKAGQDALKATGEAREKARERLAKLREQLQRLTKNLMDALLGRKNADELEKELDDDTIDVETYALDARVEELIRQIRIKIIQAVEALGKARERAGELAGDSKEALAKAREELKRLTQEMKDALLGRKNADEIEKDLSAFAIEPMSADNYILPKEILAKLRERIAEITVELKKAGEEVLKATGAAKDAAKERFRNLQQRLQKLTKDMMDAILGRKTADDLQKELDEPL